MKFVTLTSRTYNDKIRVNFDLVIYYEQLRFENGAMVTRISFIHNNSRSTIDVSESPEEIDKMLLSVWENS